jgi:hypothetical protein
MDHPHSLVRWDADAIAGWEREAPTAADDPAARVALLSPEMPAAAATELIPSWGADTPPGAWVELQLRASTASGWGRLFRVARWDGAPAASLRTSFDAQQGEDGELATDTLLLARPAEAVQARVLLCGEPGADMAELESLALALTRPGGPIEAGAPPPSAVQLPLLISQYLVDAEAGQNWCSPVALTMALAYWRARTGDPRLAPYAHAAAVPGLAAPMIFDPGWDGTGNWAFNTAFAASLGLTAYVTRLHSLEQLARWTAAGVPVPISIRWAPGELDGAAGSSAGHITVVRGFAGDQVLMAEPAARELAAVTRSYRADQLFACWQRASRGVAYIVHPPGWPRPAPGPGDAWA